jgi:gliding motility-associated-like protein
VPEQTEAPVEETIEIETPALADHQFTIADHFSPNQDGWNDGFSPALQLPADFKFIQWSLYRNQQWIRSWNENNSWDGNDLGGYPMESGTYHYTLTYEDDQQVVHTKKGTISLQR